MSISSDATRHASMMPHGSRTPLVPASILNKMSDPSVGQQTPGNSSADQYSQLLRENVSLAKENARLKRSYRDLMERKLRMDASQAAKKITAPDSVDLHEKQQLLLNVKDKFADISDEISRAQIKLSELVRLSSSNSLIAPPAHGSVPSVDQLRVEPPVVIRRAVSARISDVLVKKKAAPQVKTMEELQSKENVCPANMTMAPKKKQTVRSTGLIPKSSTCRIGNMIVKRNSWNLAFQSLRPAFGNRSREAESRGSGSSVYDFD